MIEHSVLICILTALLTGGFIMMFIESHKVAANVTDRFHFIMDPFIRSFSSYARFISSFKSYFSFKTTKDSDYLNLLKDDVEKIARLGGQLIMSGKDLPSDYFSAKELDSICQSINNIWYYNDRYRNYIDQYLEFDSRFVKTFGQNTKEYLDGISSKYKGMRLSKDMLAKVSGEFYIDIYQPIQDVLFQYEFWQKKEKRFRLLTISTILIVVITLILILLLSYYIPILIFNMLCVLSCILLLLSLFYLVKLENLANKIMR